MSTQSGKDLSLLTQAETDDLLQRVNNQITDQTFDLNDHACLQQLVECLSDTRGITRLNIVETLGKIGQPATPFLKNALCHHPNPVVRRSAAKALAIIVDPMAVPTLIKALLNDADTVVKGSSVGALAKMGEVAVPALLEVLASPDYPATAKGHATWALAFIGPEAQAYLDQAISSNSHEVRAAVVGAIARIASEKSTKEGFITLISALNDKASIVLCEAAAALGNLGYQSAMPKLVEVLNHQDWETRKSAAMALMKIGDTQALDALETSLNQESEVAVQKVIELAISQLRKRIV